MLVLLSSRTRMNGKDQDFFKALGARIAQARKAQDSTQQEVADRLGIAQHTYAQYELGVRRIPASMLPQLARDLSLTMDELMGQDERQRSKPGPTPKLLKQFERISQLPRTKQQVLMEMLDGLLAQASH